MSIIDNSNITEVYFPSSMIFTKYGLVPSLQQESLKHLKNNTNLNFWNEIVSTIIVFEFEEQIGDKLCQKINRFESSDGFTILDIYSILGKFYGEIILENKLFSIERSCHGFSYDKKSHEITIKS